MPLLVWGSAGLKALDELWGSVVFAYARSYSMSSVSFADRHVEGLFVVDMYGTEGRMEGAFQLLLASPFYPLFVLYQGLSEAGLYNIYGGGKGSLQLVMFMRTGATVAWWSNWHGISMNLGINNNHLAMDSAVGPRAEIALWTVGRQVYASVQINVNYIISYKLLFPFLL